MSLQTKYIEIVPYNSDWQKLFEIESAKIKEVLGGNIVAIDHIGSTSVPGLNAKKDLDILLEKDRLQLDKLRAEIAEQIAIEETKLNDIKRKNLI